MSKLPPRRLCALPIDDTVMSIVWPGFENGGSVACTVTAATLRSCGLTLSGTSTPSCAEHVLDGLDRERRLARLIAGAVEADDEAIADELVAANAGDRREVLDALGARRARTRRAASTRRARRRRNAVTMRVMSALLRLQNGKYGELKNRVSQPGRFGSARLPLPL